MSIFLGLEVLQNSLDFLLAGRLIQMYEEIGGAQIAVILWNFILQDQVISKRIPGQLAHKAMILVQVVAAVGEDDVWGYILLKFFKIFFDLHADERKETISKTFHNYTLVADLAEKRLGALLRFDDSLFLVGTQHHPVNT